MSDASARSAVVVFPPRPVQSVSWHSFDLKTGKRGPQVTVRAGSVPISRILNEATEAEVQVQMWRNGAPVPGWEAATEPSRVMLVAIDNLTEQPLWGGMVYRRRSSRDEWATVNMVTLEAYLDRRYVNKDYTFTKADQISVIAATIIQDTMTGPIGNGVNFTIDAPYSNWKRDRSYTVDEDKTVLSVLQELAGVENGIEFTVDLGWVDAERAYLDRIFRIRNRVGTAYTGSFGVSQSHPPATFTMPGSVVDFEYVEDYSEGKGANAVLASSSGEGDSRPESKLWMAAPIFEGTGWAMFEYRYTPSTSITDVATLNSHAITTEQEMWDGMNELTIEANLATAPRLGVDWFLGDDVAVSLTCARFPEREGTDGTSAPGYQANVRCIGYEIDFEAGRIKPRLLEAKPVEVLTL